MTPQISWQDERKHFLVVRLAFKNVCHKSFGFPLACFDVNCTRKSFWEWILFTVFLCAVQIQLESLKRSHLVQLTCMLQSHILRRLCCKYLSVPTIVIYLVGTRVPARFQRLSAHESRIAMEPLRNSGVYLLLNKHVDATDDHICTICFKPMTIRIWLSCRPSRKLSMVEGRFSKWF